MRSTDRRKELLNWLENEGTLSLAEMVARFKVSKMTIHRDLDLLEQRQLLKRIHGGAARLERGREGRETARTEAASCFICFRPPSQHLLYTLTLKNGEQKIACCPHCGISAHLMLGDKISMVLTADYLTGRLHSAQHSYFIMGSVADPCCKPSILTFESEEMACRFQKGFGGELGRLSDAIAYLKEDMTLNKDAGCPHCSPKLTVISSNT